MHGLSHRTRYLGYALSALLLASCGLQTYQPKPLQAEDRAARLQSADPLSQEFQAYLSSYGYQPLPLQQWGLVELGLAALYFHPDLQLARAQWQAAVAAEVTARQRPNPKLGAEIENNREAQSGESPWTFGLSLEIPIITAGKIEARTARATALSEARRIEIAQAAWQVYSRVASHWLDYQMTLQRIAYYQQRVAVQQAQADMLQKRFELGMLGSSELNRVKLELLRGQQLLGIEQAKLPARKAALAYSSGLSETTLERLPLRDWEPEGMQQSPPLDSAALQQAALLNRLDIRAALARYSAAEANLRLEIARQYPDLSLSPGYMFDQGDRLWQLGIASLLNIANKNQGLIAEARALRETEAAQFDVLQAGVLANLARSRANYGAALDFLAQAERLYQAEDQHFSQLQRQFERGLIDRLQLAEADLNRLQSRENKLLAAEQLQRATLELEQVLQRPLHSNSSVPPGLRSDTRPRSDIVNDLTMAPAPSKPGTPPQAQRNDASTRQEPGQ